MYFKSLISSDADERVTSFVANLTFYIKLSIEKRTKL